MSETSKSFEKHVPVFPLPNEILEMQRDETVCQFCGVSYLIHNEIKKLEDKIKELEQKVRDYDFMKQKMKNYDQINDDLNLKIQNLEEKVSDRTQMISSLNNDLESRGLESNRLRKKVQDLENENYACSASMQALKNKYLKYKSVVMDTQVTLSSQKSDLKAIEVQSKDQMSMMRHYVSSLQTQVQRFFQKISQESVDRAEQENSFRSQVKQLTRENESYKESIDSYAKQISSFQGLKAELESQITILSSQLNQSSDLKSKLVNFEQQKQQLIQENSNLREEMNQVKASSNNMVIENSELSEKIALLNEKIDQVIMKNQSEIKAKNEEMGRLKNELNQTKRRYEDQEKFENEILANNKSNMSEINRLKNELKKSTDQISELENEIKSLTLAHQCQIVQLKDSFKERLRKNDQWPEKLEAELTKERNKHAEALDQLEAEMKKSFKMELEIHNQKYDELYVKYQKIISDNQNMSKETLAKMEADNKNLATELKNVHEEKLRNEKKLRQELDNLRAITKDLHERLEKYSGDETENSIGHLKQKVMDKDSAICDLRAKLKQSEAQLDEFRDEIRVLQDTVHNECLEREELLEKLEKARDELLVFKKNTYSSQVMPLNKSVSKSPKNQNGALIDLDFAKNINELEAQKNNSRRNSTPSALNRTGSEKSQPESMSKPVDSGKSHRAKIINKETISLLNSNTSNEPIQLFKKINELSNITNKQKPAHQHSLVNSSNSENKKRISLLLARKS